MADENKAEGKKSGVLGQILTSVVVAMLVGGTSPWWFNAFFGKSTPKPAPPAATLTQESTTKPPEAAPNHPEVPVKSQNVAPVASRDYFLGRWRVEQSFDWASGTNEVDYFDNGRFEGVELDVLQGNQGRKIHHSGKWEFEKLSDQTFRLTLRNDDGTVWTGKFRVLDQNHIHNTDMNYVAERVE